MEALEEMDSSETKSFLERISLFVTWFTELYLVRDLLIRADTSEQLGSYRNMTP